VTETVTAGGQAQADSTGTTAAAPAQAQTSGGQAQTTGNGSGAVAEESFLDPRAIEGKPELLAAYKQMQGEFTRRNQKFSARAQDLQLVDRFRADPMGTLHQIAQQYGARILQGGAEPQKEDWNPQSWDDVKKHFFEEFKKEHLNPLVGEVRTLKKQGVEQHLDSKFPDWRTYEDAMMEKLQAHPSLVNDPDSLYRLAVPSNVWEARATQAAMARIKGATESAQVSGGTTAKQTSSEPTGALSFNQAIEVAKKRLASQGLKGPAN
jgi:hypothetical protein